MWSLLMWAGPDHNHNHASLSIITIPAKYVEGWLQIVTWYSAKIPLHLGLNIIINFVNSISQNTKTEFNRRCATVILYMWASPVSESRSSPHVFRKSSWLLNFNICCEFLWWSSFSIKWLVMLDNRTWFNLVEALKSPVANGCQIVGLAFCCPRKIDELLNQFQHNLPS